MIYSVDNKLYYSGNSRIDAIDSEHNWSNFAKFSFSVDLMTGDATSGQIIVASRQTGQIYVVDSTGNATMLVESATSAIAAQSGVLYYAVSDDEYGYESKVLSCNISNCIPSSPVAKATLSITSLSVDSDGNLFYSTSEGIFPVQGVEPTIPYKKNITPFALAYHESSDMLYFLDIDVKQGL